MAQAQGVKEKATAVKQVKPTEPLGSEPALKKSQGPVTAGGQKEIIKPVDRGGSGKNGINWLQTTRNARSLSYIENLGQCEDVDGVPASEILYTFRDNNMDVFFTKKGLIYQLFSREKVSDRVWEKYVKENNIKELKDEENEKEGKKDHYIPHLSHVQMNWAGSDPQVQIDPANVLSNYFSYYNPLKDKNKIIGHVRGFQKITYKNIYPNIDIEYTIHDGSGLEYACILHPGADPNMIKMVYTGTDLRQDADKNIILPTNIGNITDHAPETFLGSVSSGEKLGSSFSVLAKNTIGFKLASGDEKITQTTIIDPWTVGPPTLIKETTLDIATDPASDLFVYSSDAGHGTYAQKFNSAGALQWTMNLFGDFNYNNASQGDIGADNSNNVYLSEGLGAAFGSTYNTIKVDPTASFLLWGTNTGGLSSQDLWESWDITFDCNQSNLIQSGGGFYNGTVYYNVSSYGIVNTATGVEGATHEDDALGDIISSFWAPSGLLYHLCSDPNSPATRTGAATSGNLNTLICVDPSSGFSRIFTVNTGYHFADGDPKAGVSTGMNGIASSCTFLYTTDGAVVDKWDLLTGAHKASAAVPGGSNSLGSVNSGIVCDKCGNVYVGSNGTIEIFDANLNSIGNIGGLPDVVTDMAWAKSGELYACGGTRGASPFATAISVATCSLGSSGLSLSVTQPTCAVKGSCTATVSFCGAPYSYSWSEGSSTQTVGNLDPGTYTVSVSGSVTCPFAYTDVNTFTINAAPNTVGGSISPTNVNCNGACNGSATVTPSGGTGAGTYTYAWSGGGGTAATASSLCAATYTCVITDANGCQNSPTAVISEPSALTSGQVSQTNVLCHGNATGAATVSAANGAGGYTYTWSPAPGGGQGTVTATGLSSGANTCTIHDANGCASSQVFTLTQPAVALSSSQSSQTNVLCTGNTTGAATVAAANGAGGYSYTWSPAPGGGQGTTTATGLSAGANTCTIHDANGCPTSQVFTLTQPAVALSSSQSSQTNVLCTGNATGAATVAAANGDGGYSYTWSPAPGGGQGTTTATGLSAGANTCTIHDANGCTTSQVFTLTQPGVALSSSQSSQTNVLCTGNTTGAATVAAANGAGGYSYTWSPAPGGGQGTTTATGLSAGANTVTIHDANGCTTSQVFTLTQPAVLLSSSQVSQTNVLCNGNSTGVATVAAANGAGGYSYTWSPAPGAGQGTTSATGLPAGIPYTCTIHDANGCLTSQVFTLTQPGTSLSVSSQSSTLTGCGVATGTATVTATGGTGADTYTWAPAPGGGQGTVTATGLSASNYTVTVHDANGCPVTQTYSITTAGGPSVTLSSSANAKCNVSCDGTATVNPTGGTGTYTYSWSGNPSTTATANSLCAGTYTCTIKDGNNCAITQTATITAPSVLTASSGSQTNALCNGASSGAATVSVIGGTAGYTYSWTGGAIGGGQTTTTATGLALGTYTCTVNDAHNCVSSQVFNITQPVLLTATASGSTQTGCGVSTGSATVSAGGGTGADTYTWSPVPGAGQGTVTATGLAGATYTVTVHDANNCPASTTFNITAAGGPSASLASSANAQCNSSCDGTASVTALGGTGAYIYSWAPSGGTASTANALCANTYTCTITDHNNCSTSQTVTITAPSVLAASATSQTNVLCTGNSTGSATVSALGGFGAYTYSWTGGTITAGQGTVSASGLAQGTYTCSVTDAHGCPASQTFTISQPVTSLSSSQVGQTNVSCNGNATGNATVLASGGTGTDTYSWTGGTITGGQGTAAATGLATGAYTCSITDANGCPSSQIFNITQPATAVSSTQVSQTNVLCTGNTTGAATVSASGGAGAFTYSWTGGAIPAGQGTVTASGLSQGTYTCLINDANGCGSTQVFTIAQPAFSLGSAQVSQTNVDCNGNSSAAATVSANGGTVNYTYSWTGGTITGGQGTATASGLAQGTYTCIISDANGCTTSQTFILTQPAAPLSAAIASQSNVSCNGGSTGNVSVTPNGGTANYTWSWSPGIASTTPTANGLTAGTYTCTLTDANKCTTTQSVTITQPALALSGTGTNSPATCTLLNGSASVIPTGGSPGYTYSWSNGGNTSSVAGLGTGNYTCTITDSLACTAAVTVTVTSVGTKPVASLVPGGTTSFCAGTSKILAASGGTSYSWNTGATTNFISVTAAGVYTVYVINSCGVDSAYATTILNPLPNPTITGSDTLCHGDSTLLVASGGASYLWSTGSTSAAIYVSSTGNYSVAATNTCGTTTATLPVFVSSVTADFIPSTTSGSHPLPVTFRDSSSASSVSWAWNFGDGSTATGQNGNDYTYNTPGTYTVTLTTTNAQHCTSTHSEIIVISDINSWMTVPNVFTPNDDGVNDVFQVSAAGINSFNAKIYDRWGVAMAELISPGEGWDGRTQSGLLATNGTYYYVIHAKGEDGKVFDLTGFVMLVRSQ